MWPPCLATRIPTVLAVRVVWDHFKADLSLLELATLSLADVTSLLVVCLYASYTCRYTCPTWGIGILTDVYIVQPWGQQCPSLVANLVTEDIEQWVLATCSLQPPLWKRHIDDILTAFLPDQIKQFHQHINSIESSIQFMIEEEANGSTPSLDTRVILHDDGSLTTVFRKQTHTNQYIDFTHLTTKLQWSEPCLPVQTRSVLSSQTRTQKESMSPETSE